MYRLKVKGTQGFWEDGRLGSNLYIDFSTIYQLLRENLPDVMLLELWRLLKACNFCKNAWR